MGAEESPGKLKGRGAKTRKTRVVKREAYSRRDFKGFPNGEEIYDTITRLIDEEKIEPNKREGIFCTVFKHLQANARKSINFPVHEMTPDLGGSESLGTKELLAVLLSISRREVDKLVEHSTKELKVDVFVELSEGTNTLIRFPIRYYTTSEDLIGYVLKDRGVADSPLDYQLAVVKSPFKGKNKIKSMMCAVGANLNSPVAHKQARTLYPHQYPLQELGEAPKVIYTNNDVLPRVVSAYFYVTPREAQPLTVYHRRKDGKVEEDVLYLRTSVNANEVIEQCIDNFDLENDPIAYKLVMKTFEFEEIKLTERDKPLTLKLLYSDDPDTPPEYPQFIIEGRTPTTDEDTPIPVIESAPLVSPPQAYQTGDDSHLLQDIRELETENRSLKQNNQNLDDKLKTIKKQLVTANTQVKELKLKKRQLESDYKKEKKAASKYRKEFKKTSGKIEDLENRVQYYEELDAIRKTEFEAAIDTSFDNSKSPEISQSERQDTATPTPSMSVREMLEGSLAALRATNKQLEKKLEERDREISHKEKTARKLDGKISDLENRLIMREAQIEELQSFKEGYSAMQDKLQAKSDTAQSVTDELIKVRLEMKELEVYLNEHEDMVYEYQQKLAEQKEEVGRKQLECENGECLYAQNLLQARLETLNQLNDLNTEIENQEAQLQQIKEQQVELNERLATTSNQRKRQAIVNEIALLQSDELTLVMDVDILRASLHKINTNLVDRNCLGCSYQGSEINRLRQSRRELMAKLEETQLALAEKEFELSEMRRHVNNAN